MIKTFGVKKSMTQVFDAAGLVWPVTVVSVEQPASSAGGPEFSVGDIVAVSGVSKGKGFQGVVKRHGFHGGPRSHGQKHSEREPGSIGGGLRTRVPKGMRMAGRMGGGRVTVRNLKVVAVDKAGGEILISGAVPGRRGAKLEIRHASQSL